MFLLTVALFKNKTQPILFILFPSFNPMTFRDGNVWVGELENAAKHIVFRAIHLHLDQQSQFLAIALLGAFLSVFISVTLDPGGPKVSCIPYRLQNRLDVCFSCASRFFVSDVPSKSSLSNLPS